MTEKWERDGTTIYALNERGVNRWIAQVQHCNAKDSTPEEREAVAKLMQAAPEMRAELKALLAEWDAAGLQSQQSERIRVLLQTTDHPR